MTETSFDDPTYGAVETATSAPTVHYVNEAGLSEELMAEVKENRDIANLIEKWSQSLSGYNQPSLDVFGRKKWEGARHTFAQMSLCAWAVEYDDILSTLADVTESLSFDSCSFELHDRDQEDIWNQWAKTVDLDTVLRQMARELFKVSQVYVGLWWQTKTYTVRDQPQSDALLTLQTQEALREKQQIQLQKEAGMPTLPPIKDMPKSGKGNRTRKKKYTITVPTAVTIFDPTKVLPVGTLMFGRERFAYCATRGEDEAFAKAMRGDVFDATVLQLLEGKYEPTLDEIAACSELGVDSGSLWLFRKDAVFRHSLTRASYERFAPIRLSGVLPILDMKEHLRASDRASLMGNANFIVVITKGTDKLPAKPAEIENLREQARVVARLPVLVGDHRLNVEIVAPPLDNTLLESRWQVLDSRLVFAALRSFQPIVQGGNAASGVSEMSRVVSTWLESRRHQIVRSLESGIFDQIAEKNPSLTESPALTFQPKHITLDFKADVINAILKLRDRGDISRESMLEELGFDQDVEALRRADEKMYYDDIFQSGTPFSSPQMNPYGTDGQMPAKPGEPAKPGQPAAKKPAKDVPLKEGGRPSGS